MWKRIAITALMGLFFRVQAQNSPGFVAHLQEAIHLNS